MSDHNSALFLRFRADNDMRALAKVFDRTAPELASVARHLARSSDEAEDLVQATFLAAIESSALFDPRRPLLPWLLGILTLQARKQRERANRELDPQRVRAPQAAEPEREVQMLEISSAVEAAVRQLDCNYSDIVRRHLLEGATPSMLAREFDLSSITARVRLHRGIKQLRKLLPASMAGTAFGVGMFNINLKSLRSKVLERASQLTGAPLPAASFVSAGLVLALLVPIAVATPAVIAWRARVSAQPAALEPALAAAESQPAPTANSIEALVAPMPEPNAVVRAAQPASSTQGELATVRGRMLRADGAVATGAMLRLSGNRGSNTPEGSGSNWSDPEPISSTEEGRFEFQFAPPEGYAFSLRVDAPDCASASWFWWELQAGSTLDLGDVRLEVAGSLLATLVNEQGEPLFEGWSMTATVTPPDKSHGRTSAFVQGTRNTVDSTFALAGLPARRVELQARTQGGAWSEKRIVEVVAGHQTPVQLVYRGPDLRKRISCILRLPTTLPLLLQPQHIWIEQPGSAPREAEYVQGSSQHYGIDDLEPGSYTVRLEDPRLLPWSQDNVQPGETVRPLVQGNAALKLAIFEPDQSRYLGRYSLSVKRYGNSTPGGIKPLVSAAVDPPENGLILYVVPGDYELELKIEGRTPKKLVVSALQAYETREIEASFSAAAAVHGRVLASDGTSGAANVDVQLTRGAVAGHLMGAGTQIMWESASIPPIHTRTTTDANGNFSFNGLQAGEWTVRAAWNRWLWVDRTVTLPLATPIEIAPPASGFFSGRLLLPESAQVDDIALDVSMAAEGQGYQPLTTAPEPGALDADGSFHLGPIPVGTIEVGFMVFAEVFDGLGPGKTGIGEHIGMFQIAAGTPTPVEIDLRTVYPAQLRGSVKVDGVPAPGGHVLARGSQGGSGGFENASSGVTLEGLYSLGVIAANLEFSLEYVAPAGWSWNHSLPLILAPGSVHEQAIAIETIEREVLVLDALTQQPRANQRIAWRTGRDFAATTDDPAALAKWTAKTDAQGRILVRLPAGPARAVALPSGSFTPATVEWTHGSATIVLQFTSGQ